MRADDDVFFLAKGEDVVHEDSTSSRISCVMYNGLLFAQRHNDASADNYTPSRAPEIEDDQQDPQLP